MRRNSAIDISTLPDERLEALVGDGFGHRAKHDHGRERGSGPAEMGRDVVGYVTAARLEGDWDNYQCKQLSARLSETAAFVELGKIFMPTADCEYRLPRAYYLVAPCGVGRNEKSFIAHLERFRQPFFDRRDTQIASELVENSKVALSDGTRAAIVSFDFMQVPVLHSKGLADDAAMQPVLVPWFGVDPGPVPRGVVPACVAPEEAACPGQQVELYGERDGRTFSSRGAVLQHAIWGGHLRTQRTRYFEAAAFDRY